MDSTNRPPPPEGPPPSYAFVTRVYKRSLRPVVIAVAFLAGLWSLLSAIGFFRNVPFYNREDAHSLAIVSIIIGAIYMFVAAVEGLGIYAGASQKLAPARIFAWGSAAVFLAIAGVGLVRVIIHFTKKSTIIDVCINTANGATFVYTGFWGPIRSGTLTLDEATRWCNRSWDRGSWSEIIAFLATSFLAAMFASVAFGYYRQLLDPSSVANAWRAPSNQIRAEGFPQHYAPPYNAGGHVPPYPAYGPYTPSAAAPYGGYPTYAPPPGPPPAESKPPGYEGWGYGPRDDSKNPFASDRDHEAQREGGSRPPP